MKQLIIIHYSEIGLKGKNRAFFEKKLIENIKRVLNSTAGVRVKRISGRFLVEFKNKAVWPVIKEKLQKIFGIEYFAFAFEVKQNLEEFKKKSLELIREDDFKTFAVRAKRSNKTFPLKSIEVERMVGEYLFENLKNKKVDLKNPDIICQIEIVEKNAFIYFAKADGPGGLPVGVSGRAMALLSGGFDSPVAAWQLARRGAEVILAHFHSYPNTSRGSIKKVKELAKILSQYQLSSKLYLVPFLDIQKMIVADAPAKLRVILYRRQMLKIAERLAWREGALALVTGDSLGQVASQTLENIRAVSEAVKLPVFRPLIGMDKKDIIDFSKKIGAYDISKEPFEDCCSLFVPKHPETKAKPDELIRAEAELNKIDDKIKEAIDKSELLIID